MNFLHRQRYDSDDDDDDCQITTEEETDFGSNYYFLFLLFLVIVIWLYCYIVLLLYNCCFCFVFHCLLFLLFSGNIRQNINTYIFEGASQLVSVLNVHCCHFLIYNLLSVYLYIEE